MRVLVVDDDAIAVAVLERDLTLHGHTVETASNGAEALEILRQDQCRLVIADWEMPVMNGLELCRQIRQLETSGYIYVMLVTARDGSSDVIEGLSAGADDFIRKPYDMAEFRVRIRAAERVLSLETRDVAIFSMAKLADSRDPETGSHLERVRAYSRALAQRLLERPAFRATVDPEFVRLIWLTSPLHDIGKVGIPDSVLLKPGRLSDREFEIMKTHTTIGAETLAAALEQFPNVKFLHMARDIAATHHERWDGTGYPKGLRGADIPLSGRIVAIADVYDALTTKRVYKKAYAHDVARSIIQSESGKHFDPTLVEVFMEVEDEFLAIRARYIEELVGSEWAASYQ
jgi:putative two-component system response regulator